MGSPFAALSWEIWQRGRRSAWLVLACVSFCALVNVLHADSNHAVFSTVFGLLMVLSFLFLMGLFNCTETSSTKEWNGFPYRLFVLPVPTAQLVAVPMFLGLATVELVYFAWLKLVWTHGQIVHPEWYAAVVGTYFLYYQTIVWSLAGFRILRTVVLSVGGVSSFLVACLPVFRQAGIITSPWVTERRLLPLLAGAASFSFFVSWSVVARQRHGGGRRQSWFKSLVNWLQDALPRRTKDFASPSAAQFWFEWRRTGWLMPTCTAFVLVVIIAPLSWEMRADQTFTVETLFWLGGTPLVLGFLLGRGFIKPDFSALTLAVPPFLAVRPLPAGDFVAVKLRVAALTAALSWSFILVFLALWLPLWANTTQLSWWMFELRLFYPFTWPLLVLLSLAGLMLLTWRGLVSGLWLGLSGNRVHYVGSICLQIIVPSLVSLVCAFLSDDIDRAIKNYPVQSLSIALGVSGWVLALLVVGKLWWAVFSWSNIHPRPARRYLLLWLGVTLSLVILAILAAPPFDVYRFEHLYVLAALWAVPLARLGLAPRALARNRARANSGAPNLL